MNRETLYDTAPLVPIEHGQLVLPTGRLDLVDDWFDCKVTHKVNRQEVGVVIAKMKQRNITLLLVVFGDKVGWTTQIYLIPIRNDL